MYECMYERPKHNLLPTQIMSEFQLCWQCTFTLMFMSGSSVRHSPSHAASVPNASPTRRLVAFVAGDCLRKARRPVLQTARAPRGSLCHQKHSAQNGGPAPRRSRPQRPVRTSGTRTGCFRSPLHSSGFSVIYSLFLPLLMPSVSTCQSEFHSFRRKAPA